MSLNFGTENVYFIPEGESLRFYDIYNMRRVEIDPARWRLFYNKSRLGRIREAVDSARNRWEKHQEDPAALDRGKKAIDTFLDSLPGKKYPRSGLFHTRDLFNVHQTTFWVRCSDVALESFQLEDYREPGAKYTKGRDAPIVGSIYLSSIGDFELSIYENVEQEGFFLKIPEKSGIHQSPLPPDEILPFHEEFFGAFGSSGKGRLVNLSPKAGISGENLCCTPLYRIGSNYFVTLYFYIRTNVEYDVLLRFSEGRIDYVRAVFAELGFKLTRENMGNEVYARQSSTVHLYTNAMGKETFGSRFLPPFFLVTRNEGSLDPAKRSKLMKELIPRFAR